MSFQDYLSGVGFLLAVMTGTALAEAVVPLFTAGRLPPGRRRANLAMTAQTLSFNFLLASLFSFLVPALEAAAPTNGGNAWWILRVGVGVIALDFAFGYFAHRAMHAVPLLWRFHRVHHSDAFVDVTTTYRTHPVESAWRYACLLVPIWFLGLPAPVVAVYRVVSAVNGILEHANIRVPPALDALFSRLWVTPNMHKVHHSRVAAETDTNYGNLFSLHDRLLGTFTPSGRAFGVRYGLDDADHSGGESFLGLLALPLRTGGAAPAAPDASLVRR